MVNAYRVLMRVLERCLVDYLVRIEYGNVGHRANFQAAAITDIDLSFYLYLLEKV